MMTYIEIEHCDLYIAEMESIFLTLNMLAEKEHKSFEDNKRIRDIIDDLAMYNITFKLSNINMLQYTLLLTLRELNIEFIHSIGYEAIEFDDDELNEEYDRLLCKAYDIEELLLSKYNDLFNKQAIEYILPNSKLVDIRMSISMKEFIELIHTCSKYDELMNIVLAISNNSILERIVTVANSLYDFIHTEDIFIRTTIAESVREDLVTHGTNLMVLSNTDYINEQLDNGVSNMKMSTLAHCSLVAFRDLVRRSYNFNMKLENFKYKHITQNEIILPEEYSKIEEDDLNLIDKYIYDWIVFIDKLENSGNYYSNELTLCNLGCFGHIVRMNAKVSHYFNLEYFNISSEVMDMVNNLTLKI